MSGNYLLGIDIGTSDVKAVIFSKTGEEMYCYKKPSTLISKQRGMYELDMNELWDSIVVILKELFSNSDIKASDIKSIGVCGQGEGAWLIDTEGEPVRNAILWNDVRAIDCVKAMDNTFIKRHKEITGSEPGAGGTNFILKWLSENEPETLERANCCFFCKDWISFKLTGNKVVEYTDMSTSLLDLKTNKISSEMFEMLNIEYCEKLFPKLVSSHDIVGYISDEVEKLTGLSSGTPVVAGYIDVVSTGIGIGAINEDEVCTILGTSCVNEFVSSDLNKFEGNAAYLKHGDLNKYFCLIGAMSGTPNIDWVIKTLFPDILKEYGNTPELFSFLDTQILKSPIGAKGIIYHPYIRGERAPFLDINAKSSFFGISEDSNRWDFLRAIYEGLAYSIKDCFQTYSPKHLYLTGGGANSYVLCQIISNCLGIPVTISYSKEVGARGAAIAAGIGANLFSDLVDGVTKFKDSMITFEPDMEKSIIYQEFYSLYLNLRTEYPKFWQQRSDIINKLNL